MVIRILEHVSAASTYEEGRKIYDLIRPRLIAGEVVILSFEGILSVPSAFVNAALLQLLNDLSFDSIKKHLRIVGTTRQINALIKQRFAFSVEENSESDHLAGM